MPGPVGISSQSVLPASAPFVDAFQSVRAPTRSQLVDQYRSLVFFLSNINAKAVWQTPMRLYSVAGPGKPVPRSACCPRQLNGRQVRRLIDRELPWITRSLAGAESVHEITEHPLLDLMEAPDPSGVFDWSQVLGLIVRYMDVCGTAYCKVTSNAFGLPVAIEPLQSHLVFPVRSTNLARIEAYQYFTNTIPVDQMLRFRLYPSLRDPWGEANSPAEAGCQYVGLEDKWISIQSQILGNGSRPDLIVTAKTALDGFGPKERDRLEQELNAKHSRSNAGRKIMVVDGVLEVKPYSHVPADLAGLDISNYNLERAANCFDVPLPFLTRDTNLANFQAAERHHAKHGVNPRCETIASIFTALVRRFDRRLFCAFDDACGEDEENEAKIFDMKLKSGVLTINEVRTEDGCEPVEWGDEPWFSNSLAQPSAMEKQREQAAAQAAAMLANGGAKPGGPPKPGDDAKPEEDPAEKPKAPNVERSLTRRLARVLRKLESSIDDTPPVSGWLSDGSYRRGDPSTPSAESPDARGVDPARRRRKLDSVRRRDRPGRDEPVSPASGDADPPATEEVVQSAGETDLGDNPGDRSPAPGNVSESNGLLRPDGNGDDSDVVVVLG